jgi:hypothetical protein
VVLAEGFNNVAGLTAAGFAETNNSAAPLGQPWFQGNAGIFGAEAGPAGSYAAASYLSTSASTGAVLIWVFTPVLTLNSASDQAAHPHGQCGAPARARWPERRMTRVYFRPAQLA